MFHLKEQIKELQNCWIYFLISEYLAHDPCICMSQKFTISLQEKVEIFRLFQF